VIGERPTLVPGVTAVSGRATHDERWLELVADLMARPLVDWPAEQVIELLVETFDVPAGAYHASTAGAALVQRQWPPELFAEHCDEIERWAAEDAPREHPILRYYLVTGDIGAIQIADLPRPFADRRVLARWEERCRDTGTTDIRCQMALPLRFGPTAHRSFVIGRADRFTGREVALCGRVQRVLAGLDRQIAEFSAWSDRTGAVGAEVADASQLTPRELVVLELLATGRTAGAIARRLAVTERTVQKHLQRVYLKLGVADRLTAVRRAEVLGLVGGPPPVLARRT
jgi:DNA-binding CsgD family transcriptional regulator